MNPVKKNSTRQERTSRDEVPMLAMQEINKILCHLQKVFNCIVQCDFTSPNIVPNDEYGREVSLAIVENFWFPSLRIKRRRAGRQLFLILLTSLNIEVLLQHLSYFYLAVWSSGMILA